jgi:streptogramin lyase
MPGLNLRCSRTFRLLLAIALGAALAILGTLPLAAPVARAAGPASSLFVSSYQTNQVLRYDGATGAFVDVFAPGGGLDLPWGITFGPDGNLYVSSYNTNQVLRYDGLTGDFIDAFTSGRQLISPTGLVFGPDGNLYVTSGGDQIVRFNGATGAYIDVFISGSGLNGPTGLVFSPDVDLYVSSYNNDQIVRFDGATGDYLNTLPAGNDLAGPDGLVFGPDGNLYVSSYNSDRVLRYNGTTGAFVDTFVPGGSGGLSAPSGLTFGPDGNLYVSSYNSNQVLRYNGATGAFVDAFASGGGLKGPAHLVFRSAPQISQQPASQTIARGQSATLSVVATGVGPFAYQWYQGPSGDPSKPIIGATGSSYTTPALTATSQYWVRVINAEGAVDSATATVTTTDAPVITSQPASQTISSGGSATLSVGVLGANPLAYQWYRGARGDISQPIAGATGSSYTTPALTATSHYWVRISNAQGQADSESALVLVAVANIRLPIVQR